jgi:phosphonate transport system ATP-binding protein
MNNKQFRKKMSKIGYIPQSLGLVKNISVLENVLIGALPRIGKLNSFLKNFPEHEIDDAKKIIKLVGLKGKENRKTYMLSGGEKRRVAIARALMQKPDLLLADEIVSELDQVTTKEIMDLIADAQKRLNLTAVMVHHDMKIALEYANRVAVIKEGQKILEIGIDGDKIIDFQSGNISQQEIMELYKNES